MVLVKGYFHFLLYFLCVLLFYRACDVDTHSKMGLKYSNRISLKGGSCMIVAKFGGTSLADAQQFEKVGSIIKSDPERRYIVPSAPGKQHDKDEKITDLLLTCHQIVKDGSSCASVFDRIRSRYLRIASDLKVDSDRLSKELDIAEEKIQKGETRDYAASRGEFLNGLLLAAYLDIPFVDAAQVIRFDEEGQLNQSATYNLIREHVAPLHDAVVPGFYGADEKGRIHVFSRGGSDISGALVARGLNADTYENWTDVSGFRTADPRIIPDAKFIQDMTYRELRELSYMGASVLHEDAVFPVRLAGIPTNIRNTNDPLHPGTMIHYSPLRNGVTPIVTGIAGRKGFSTVMIEKDRMNTEVGFGRKVLQVFEECHLNFEHLPTGIDAMCVILPTASLAPHRDEVMDKISRAVSPDQISIQDDMAMLAIVGTGMLRQFGTAARLFTAIAEHGISIKTMLQTPSELSILIGIDEHDLSKAISALYDAFIRT